MEHFEIPSNPIIAAGTFGGPFVIGMSTPMRNALTIAASNTQLSFAGCYRDVFSKGLVRGWTGGFYFSFAAAPQFVAVGPLYHAVASVLGPTGGVAVAALAESLIVHGPEKRNAQMSFNLKAMERSFMGGSIPAHRLQNPLNPLGAGFSIHATRNFVSIFGMRVLCDPITRLYENLAGKSQTATVAGDFSANIASACITMPIHQTWNFFVSNHEMWEKPPSEKIQMVKEYLRKQYLKPSGGISPVVFRDAGLRCSYISLSLTAYVNIERTFVAYWPVS